MAIANVEDILDLVEILRAGVRATTAQATLSLFDTQLMKKTYPPWLKEEAPPDSASPVQNHPRDGKLFKKGTKFALPFGIYLGEGFMLGGYVRKHDAPGFTRKDQQLLASLVGPLEDAARVLVKSCRIDSQAFISTAFEGDTGRDTFVVDASLQVVSHSPQIQKLLGGGAEPSVVMQGRFDFTSSTLTVPESLDTLVRRFVQSDADKATFSFFSGNRRPMIAFARRFTIPEEPLETFFAFAVQGAVVDFRTATARLGARACLTPRQLEITEHILRGTRYPEICDHLCISRDTLKSHSRQIFRKTAVRNRTELFTAAIGFLDRPAPADDEASPCV